MKLCCSPELAVIIKETSATRPRAFIKIWAYIKKHNLQCFPNKRLIDADVLLYDLFKSSRISIFDLGKIVDANLYDENDLTYEVVD